jgi:hypothetical protein
MRLRHPPLQGEGYMPEQCIDTIILREVAESTVKINKNNYLIIKIIPQTVDSSPIGTRMDTGV